MGPFGKTVLLAGLAALAAAGVRYGFTVVRSVEAEREVEAGRSRLQELEPLVTAVGQYREGRETLELETALIAELRNQPAVPWGLLDQLVDTPPAPSPGSRRTSATPRRPQREGATSKRR